MQDETQYHILIVDDNPYNLEVLSRRLVRRGYLTTCVENGTKALEQIQTGSYDLVLLDIMMPDIDGMEVLAKARKRWSKSVLPIIMVTSKGESEDVVEALNHGANDYVVKPIDFPVALARIQTQLSHKQEMRGQSITETIKIHTLGRGDRFGPYLIEDKLGQGGMGAVYKVRDPGLDRVVALKVILAGHELTLAQVERFSREAKAIARLNHTNIVSIYQIEDVPVHHFTMELIEGENLSYWIKNGMIDFQRAAVICQKMASALDAAHSKGIIHRDIKPSNIMMDHQAEPHLMDFGLAKMASEEEALTRTGDILGTPEYMAPEQFDNSCGEVDVRSDVYSLGVILYEMLTGKPPFIGPAIQILWQKLSQPVEKPSLLKSGVPLPLEQICMKAIAKDQNDRFQDALEMYHALELVI